MRTAYSVIALLAVASALSVPGASAADLYADLTDPGEYPSHIRNFGFYGRIDGGYSISSPGGLHEAGYGALSNRSLEDTGVLGGGLGMYVGRNLRVDITGDYRFEADGKGTNLDLLGPVDSERRFGVDSAVLLANIYYDFDVGARWRPYLGVGVGAVHHSTSSGSIAGGGSVDSGSNWNFAGAAMAGVSWNFGARSMPGGSAKDPIIYQEARGPFHLDIGYRFLYLGDAETGTVRDAGGVAAYDRIKVGDITAHEFRIGLRYDFR